MQCIKWEYVVKCNKIKKYRGGPLCFFFISLPTPLKNYWPSFPAFRLRMRKTTAFARNRSRTSDYQPQEPLDQLFPVICMDPVEVLTTG